MTLKIRTFVLVAAAVAALVAAATPAFAQVGSLRGKIVDETGKPVEGAEITLDFVGDYTRQFKTVTDKNGEWVRAGMPAGGGTWTITVKKGEMTGMQRGTRVQLGEMVRLDPITIKTGNAASTAAATLSAAEIAKRNKRQLELEGMFEGAKAALEAGNTDDALTKLTAITVEVPNCAACYDQIGAIQLKKGDMAAAEAAFLKSIELDATKPTPYAALATIYNTQKKFDESTKMSSKANELSGGGDAASVYNQGIASWNAGKPAEAETQFERATQMDPKMADAFYYLGMSRVNQGKLKEAKVPFETYLKLAPDGANAATAKAILDTIK